MREAIFRGCISIRLGRTRARSSEIRPVVSNGRAEEPTCSSLVIRRDSTRIYCDFVNGRSYNCQALICKSFGAVVDINEVCVRRARAAFVCHLELLWLAAKEQSPVCAGRFAAAVTSD